MLQTHSEESELTKSLNKTLKVALVILCIILLLQYYSGANSQKQAMKIPSNIDCSSYIHCIKNSYINTTELNISSGVQYLKELVKNCQEQCNLLTDVEIKWKCPLLFSLFFGILSSGRSVC